MEIPWRDSGTVVLHAGRFAALRGHGRSLRDSQDVYRCAGAVIPARVGAGNASTNHSYERQGIDRDPGRHYGPAAASMTARGREHDRLEEAVTHIDRQDTIRAIDREIDVLESSGGGRGAVGYESDRPRQQRDRATPGRDDDLSP